MCLSNLEVSILTNRINIAIAIMPPIAYLEILFNSFRLIQSKEKIKMAIILGQNVPIFGSRVDCLHVPLEQGVLGIPSLRVFPVFALTKQTHFNLYFYSQLLVDFIFTFSLSKACWFLGLQSSSNISVSQVYKDNTCMTYFHNCSRGTFSNGLKAPMQI